MWERGHHLLMWTRIFYFFGLSISNSKSDFFFDLENLIHYICLKESVLIPLQTQSHLEQNGLAPCSPKQELLAILTLELEECGYPKLRCLVNSEMYILLIT